MSEQIPPALTADEWAEVQRGEFTVPGTLLSVFRARSSFHLRDFRVILPPAGEEDLDPEQVAKLYVALGAFLRQAGQPFGFRPEMVAALSRTCDNAERWIASRMLVPLDDDALALSREAVAVIRALLPPETP